MEPDQRRLDRVLIAVVKLTAEGSFFPYRLAYRVNELDGGGQGAPGGAVVLAGQGQEPSIEVVGAQDNCYISLAGRGGGLLPIWA